MEVSKEGSGEQRMRPREFIKFSELIDIYGAGEGSSCKAVSGYNGNPIKESIVMSFCGLRCSNKGCILYNGRDGE